MKHILFLSLILLLVIPAVVVADPGDPYPGMMGYRQNGTGSYYGPGMMGYWQNGSGPYYGPDGYWQNGTGPYYGPGMMGYRQNGTGPYYGPGMMGYWQNGSGPYYGPGGYWQNGTGPYYGPGMMGNWQNTPGASDNCPCDEMMNGRGYTYNNGGMMFPFVGLMAILVIIFALVWAIAGILLIVWLYRKMQVK